ncbi:MAG: hypothetical protein ACYC3X_10230 [Pirellulaceae bacterium]
MTDAYYDISTDHDPLCEELEEDFPLRVSLISKTNTPARPDDVDSVDRENKRLVADGRNAFDTTVEDGVLLGKAMATLERWGSEVARGTVTGSSEDLAYRQDKPLWSTSVTSLTEEYRVNIDKLAGRDVCRRCSHVMTLLEQERSRIIAYFETSMVTLLKLSKARAALSFVMGELVGTMREADDEAFQKDAASPMPRLFMMSPQASLDRIRGQVYSVQQAISDRAALKLSPENVVAFAANVIEGLTKDLWPDSFTHGSRENGFPDAVHKYRRNGNELEKRFAQVALTLYDRYRNPAIREIATFRCSWEETTFFFSGIRALLDLRDRLKKEKGYPAQAVTDIAKAKSLGYRP